MKSNEECKSNKLERSHKSSKLKFGTYLDPLDENDESGKKVRSLRNSTKNVRKLSDEVFGKSSSDSSESGYEYYLQEDQISPQDSENGVMLEYISKSGSFAESTARYFFRQLLKAIIRKNKNDEYHREIKPEDIILDSEFKLKLAFYTFSSEKDCGYKIKDAPSYKAPEVIAGLKYSPKQADLFSAAVFLFMMVTQRLPFIEATPEDKYYSFIIIKDFKGFWAYHTLQCPEIVNLSKGFKDLFCKMVVVNGNDRLKIRKIKRHDWFKKPLPKRQEIFEIFSYRKLVTDGALHVDDIPEEGNITQIQKSQKSDEDEASVKTKEILEAMETMPKKYTPYYDCPDGDLMMQEIINFTKQHKYSRKVCEEYFRVIFQIKKDSKLTIIQVNILRIPKHEKRCIECICVKGEEEVFKEAFENLDIHIFRVRGSLETAIK